MNWLLVDATTYPEPPVVAGEVVASRIPDHAIGDDKAADADAAE